MHARRIAVVITAAALAAYVAPAGAQPDDGEIEMEPDPVPQPEGSGSAAAEGSAAPTKDPKLAKKLVAAGAQSMQKGDYLARKQKPDEAKPHYEAALRAYTEAIAQGDDVNLYYEVGLLEEKLGKLDVAARHWRTLVKATGAKPDVVKKTTTKLDDVLTKLGQITLVVTPEGTSIELDGAEIAKAPLAEPLIVLPGTYVFKLSAEGFQPKDTEVKVEAGAETERTIELEAIKIIVEKPVIDEEPIPAPPPKPISKLPLYLGGGATIALGVTATVTGILAVGKHGTFTGSDSSAADRRAAQDSGKRLALISDLTLVGALGAAGFTAYWYFFKYKPGQANLAAEQQPKVTVMPWVQPDTGQGGVSVLGRF